MFLFPHKSAGPDSPGTHSFLMTTDYRFHDAKLVPSHGRRGVFRHKGCAGSLRRHEKTHTFTSLALSELRTPPGVEAYASPGSKAWSNWPGLTNPANGPAEAIRVQDSAGDIIRAVNDVLNPGHT